MKCHLLNLGSEFINMSLTGSGMGIVPHPPCRCVVNLNMQCVILASYLVGRASHPGVTMAKRANCIVRIVCVVSVVLKRHYLRAAVWKRCYWTPQTAASWQANLHMHCVILSSCLGDRPNSPPCPRPSPTSNQMQFVEYVRSDPKSRGLKSRV